MHPDSFRNPFDRTSQPLRTVALIPARYASTRFPGKPLVELAGRTMIEHVYRRAAEASTVDAVAVATDDARIADAVTAFGGHAVMTGAHHPSGSDRIAEAAGGLACDVVVNVQGDEPLISPDAIDAAVAPLLSDPAVLMSTLAAPIGDPHDADDPNVVKVVLDRRGDALYFSRARIPFPRQPGTAPLRHIGLYAYRRPFLIEFAGWPRSPLEETESLEQLRALERGVRIRTLVTPYESIGVDTPGDLARVRAALERRILQHT
ncbi:MAG: 3-deoxy-manno-octulosonate cytidylyltransferase [Vicinamibacterales bacterium]